MKLLKPGDPCPCCGRPIKDGLPTGTMIFLSWLAEGMALCRATNTWEDTDPNEAVQNEPLTQADLDVMYYDKVWIDYGDDGEWALVVSGRIYDLTVLEAIENCADILDRVKIGKLNYYPSKINWADFGRAAEALCQRLGLDYYIKDSLRKEMEAQP